MYSYRSIQSILFLLICSVHLGSTTPTQPRALVSSALSVAAVLREIKYQYHVQVVRYSELRLDIHVT